MRILVVRACAIGDFVLNLPALRALSLKFPAARFTLVGYPAILELARPFIPVEGIHSIESPPWSHLFAAPLRPDLHFDAAYVWMKNPVVAENLRRSGIADVVRASPFPEGGIHGAEHLLQTVGLPAPALPDLWVAGTPQVLVHPGSGSRAKVWPYYAQLVELLGDVVIIEGPAEADFPRVGGVGRLQNPPLMELANVICRSRAFIGNDSGITHIAAYWGAPTVALFGPTDPRVWGPVGRRVQILKKPSLADISIEDVRKLL